MYEELERHPKKVNGRNVYVEDKGNDDAKIIEMEHNKNS